MRFFIIFIIAIIIYSCTNSVQKSGLTNVDKFTMSFDGMNKNEVTKIIGTPSSIDTFNNSILYFRINCNTLIKVTEILPFIVNKFILL